MCAQEALRFSLVMLVPAMLMRVIVMKCLLYMAVAREYGAVLTGGGSNKEKRKKKKRMFGKSSGYDEVGGVDGDDAGGGDGDVGGGVGLGRCGYCFPCTWAEPDPMSSLIQPPTGTGTGTGLAR